MPTGGSESSGGGEACGNGVLDALETCDVAIPTGEPGACPTTCADDVTCTSDSVVNAGTCAAECAFQVIDACAGGDGCCPIGCAPDADSDCSATCGDGVVDANELCDTGIAAEQGAPRVAVVLSWLLHHPAGVVPIVSTSRVARIRQCAEATEVGFSRQQWYEVLAASRGQSLF